MLARHVRVGLGVGAAMATLGSALAVLFASGTKLPPHAMAAEAIVVGVYTAAGATCAALDAPTGACLVGLGAQQALGAIALDVAARLDQVPHAAYATVLTTVVGCGAAGALLVVDELVRGVNAYRKRRAPAGIPVEAVVWT